MTLYTIVQGIVIRIRKPIDFQCLSCFGKGLCKDYIESNKELLETFGISLISKALLVLIAL